MTTRAAVDDFLAQETLAVAGVSRHTKKFANVVFRELKAKGYRVYPVNPSADRVENEPCYPSVGELPEKVGGVVTIVPPDQTEQVVRDAKDAGIEQVWMQLGSQSENAVRFCEENGISVIHNECILMFAEPLGFIHRVHKMIWRLLGKLPK